MIERSIFLLLPVSFKCTVGAKVIQSSFEFRVPNIYDDKIIFCQTEFENALKLFLHTSI